MGEVSGGPGKRTRREATEVVSTAGPTPGVEPADALLQWYLAKRRDLPWRRRADQGVDPWATWVSEVMLQQTRVEHVIPYFERFLSRFPSPTALAMASVDEALALWSGLGYYRRLRLLHAGARAVAAAGGRVPDDLAALRRLPGIGDYTAAAIASIAFGVAVPVLDGNVERVISRWLGSDEDPGRAAVRRGLRDAAASLLVPGAPGDSNQALMELGATVCTPRAPRCLLCPLASQCVSRRDGQAESRPRAAAQRREELVRLIVARVEDDGRLLLFRRDESSTLLAGTWELPWIERRAVDEGVDELTARLVQKYGVRLRLGAALGEVRHAITFRRLRAEVRAGVLDGSPAPVVAEGREAGWFTRDEVSSLAASSLVGKALAVAARAAAASSRATAGRRRRG